MKAKECILKLTGIIAPFDRLNKFSSKIQYVALPAPTPYPLSLPLLKIYGQKETLNKRPMRKGGLWPLGSLVHNFERSSICVYPRRVQEREMMLEEKLAIPRWNFASVFRILEDDGLRASVYCVNSFIRTRNTTWSIFAFCN